MRGATNVTGIGRVSEDGSLPLATDILVTRSDPPFAYLGCRSPPPVWRLWVVRVSVTVASGLLLISQLAEGPAPYRSPLGPVAYWAAGPRARASAAAGRFPPPGRHSLAPRPETGTPSPGNVLG